MNEFVVSLQQAGLYVGIVLAFLFISKPFVEAYTSKHLMNNAKVLSAVALWMLLNFTLIFGLPQILFN
jgi:hypothetical protein